jgi:hypothetical protein
MAIEMSVDWKKVANFKGPLMIMNARHDAPALKDQAKCFVENIAQKKLDGLHIAVGYSVSNLLTA